MKSMLLGLVVFGFVAQFPIAVRLAAQSTEADHARTARFISFGAPGAGSGAYEGTTVSGMNSHGEIVGFYTDGTFVYHGFLRGGGGKIITFDAPGAGGNGTYGTFPYGLNSSGATVGLYAYVAYLEQAFVRNPNGSFSTFADADACYRGKGCYGTRYFDINDSGAIVGSYFDADYVSHCFLVSPDGTLTTFEAPGAGNVKGSYQGTEPSLGSGLNNEGAITGSYIDANNVDHGFLRHPDGSFTTFDAPGAGAGAYQGTNVASLNDSDVIAGIYIDANNAYHGFVREADGTMVTFDAPAAGTGAGQGTLPENINATGQVTGNYIDGNNVSHGFLADPDGNLITFDAPGAGTANGTAGCGVYSDCPGTYPYSNNAGGEIAGSYIDSKNVSHGFLRIP